MHPLTKLLSTTILTLALGFAVPALAETTAVDNTSAASHIDSQDLSYAADRLINHVSNALLYLGSGVNDKAADEVEAAKKIAVALENAAPEYTTKRKVQAGRVVYNYEKNDSNYYIPLADETYTKRDYKEGPLWSSQKGLAVKKAEVVYVTLKLNSKEAEKQLAKVSDQISRGKYQDASDTLRNFSKSIVSDEIVADLPMQRARDNFFLARMLLEQGNYSGARYALSNADSALSNAANSDSTPDRQTRIKEMRADLKSLRETIKENDPTTVDKANVKLQEWWDETKDWVQNKV